MNLEQYYKKMTRKDKMEREAVLLADWMIDHDSTMVEVSKECMIPKTTAFRRVTVTLKDVDPDKWLQCKNILTRHKRVHRRRR